MKLYYGACWYSCMHCWNSIWNLYCNRRGFFYVKACMQNAIMRVVSCDKSLKNRLHEHMDYELKEEKTIFRNAFFPWKQDSRITLGRINIYDDNTFHLVTVFLETVSCAFGTGICNIHASCVNINGSFNCLCNIGYAGDGITCTGTLLIIISLLIVLELLRNLIG